MTCPRDCPFPLVVLVTLHSITAWIERHFQESHEFFDLLCCVMSRSIRSRATELALWNAGPGSQASRLRVHLVDSWASPKEEVMGSEFLAGR